MRKITDIIIFSNLLIAAGAACFIWETYLLFRLTVDPMYILIGFASTLFIYNIDRIAVLNSLENTGSERHDWITANYKKMTAISICCVLFILAAIFFLPLRSIFFLAHLGFISVAYSIPVLARGKKNLRSIKFLKIFLITYVWAASTVIMPAVGAGIRIFQKDVLLLFTERALFIFAITLPFDIRDYRSDIEHKVMTIPGLIGIRSTKVLAFFCLLVFFLINLVHYDFHSGVLWAKLISGISTFAIIVFAREGRNEYYFTGLLDGTIIIQFVLVLLLYNYNFF
jgi:4-hydroxybenzoate polyprenyltransferase